MKAQTVTIKIQPPERHPVVVVFAGLWVLLKGTLKLCVLAGKGIVILSGAIVRKVKHHTGDVK